MPHGELLRAWWWNWTSGAAPQAVRAWRWALLLLQVRELSDEASIFAVLCLKPLNLFLTLLPVHSFFLGGLVQSCGSHVSTMSPMASLADRCRLRVMCGRRRLGKNFLSCCSIGRVRSCVRPVLYGGEAAGHNALRGSGTNSKARIQRCADPNEFSRSPDRPCLHYVVMSSPIPSNFKRRRCFLASPP